MGSDLAVIKEKRPYKITAEHVERLEPWGPLLATSSHGEKIYPARRNPDRLQSSHPPNGGPPGGHNDFER